MKISRDDAQCRAEGDGLLLRLQHTLLPQRYKQKKFSCLQFIRLTIFRIVGAVQSATFTIRSRSGSRAHRNGGQRERCIGVFFRLGLAAILFFGLFSSFSSWRRRAALGTYLDPKHGFHPQWHPEKRHERFPSVEERVKLYMSNWYIPPCADYMDGRARFSYTKERRKDDSVESIRVTVTIPHSRRSKGGDDSVEFSTVIMPDTAFLVQRDVIEDCSRYNPKIWADKIRDIFTFSKPKVPEGVIHARRSMRSYCRNSMDIVDMMSISGEGTGPVEVESPVSGNMRSAQRKNAGESRVPVIMQYGDHCCSSIEKILLPHFMKFRSSTTHADLENVVSPAFGGDDNASNEERTCYNKPSRPKLKTSNGRGVHSPIIWFLESNRHFDMLDQIPYLDTPWDKKLNVAIWRGSLTGMHNFSPDRPDHENCMNNARCRVIVENHKSEIIDAGLVYPPDKVASVVDGVQLVRSRLSFHQLMRYKAIISIQGNDVASGLKWSLFSRSVVLMPPPTITSWAMEELLVPWVHYVPLYQNVSNVEERMRWVLQNEGEAQRIAERATLFIHDMMFHEAAEFDDKRVKEEMLKRYRQYFIS